MGVRSPSESRTSAMLDAALDCIVGMNADGRITAWNRAAERTFGYHRADALGRELAELIIPPALRDRHRASLRRYLETGQTSILGRRVEVTALRADGSEVAVELAVVVLPGSEPPEFTGYLREIADRLRADEERRHLAAIVQTTDDAVMSMDLDTVITSWNPGAERTFGHRAQEAVGQPVAMLVPEDLLDEPGRLMARLRRGEAIEDYETERIRADGVRIAVSLTLSPILDPLGQVSGVSVIARDITARKRAEAAKDLLTAASGALDASLDPGETVRTIAQTAVPALAEVCVIDLLREDGSIGDAAVAAIDPEVAAELEDIRRRFPLQAGGPHPVARVLRSGTAMVIRDLAKPDVVSQVAQSDEHRDFMGRTGYSSAAVVPMVARGRTLGAISLLHVRNDRRYDPGDLALVEDLAARAALALDNARLYAERSSVARTLQRSLLPAALPDVPGAELAAAYLPAGEGAEVGGDFYDAFQAGGEWLVVVGDVCGKGAEAAALTSLVRYGLRAAALEREAPSRALDLVNATMLREEREGRFATALLARLDLGASPARARLASAGHPAPLLLRAGGDPIPVPMRGSLLGVGTDPVLPEVEVELEPGDRLLLFTDGVLDAGAPGRVLSEDELAAELSASAGLDAEGLVRATVHLATGLAAGPLRDDVAVLAVRVT